MWYLSSGLLRVGCMRPPCGLLRVFKSHFFEGGGTDVGRACYN